MWFAFFTTRVLSWLIFSPVPRITPGSFPSALAARCSAPSLGSWHLGAAHCIPLAEFQGVNDHIYLIPPGLRLCQGVSHPRLVAPEALLKVHPVSVPLLLMASPVSTPGCFNHYWPPTSCRAGGGHPQSPAHSSLGKSLLALSVLRNGFRDAVLRNGSYSNYRSLY